MAAPMEHMDTVEEKVVFPLKSGASLVKIKPTFSSDNKCLFVCSGTVIKVFSTTSGECIRELYGHKDQVTGIVIHPKNRLQLLSCSLDQTLITWDYTDGVLLKQIPLAAKPYGIYTCVDVNAVYILQQTSHTGCDLVRKPLSSKGQKETLLTKCLSDSRRTAVGPKGQYCVMVSGNAMKVRDHTPGSREVRHSIDRGQELTCVACHPVNKCIATGSSDGNIYLWYKFLQRDTAVKTQLHWHALPVIDLCYTQDGSYLMSGGHECVLVKWHQESRLRDYLPRLGAPINHVVCSRDNLLYATCHDDNVIHIITSSFSIQQVYQGLTRGHQETRRTDPVPTGLVCDPRTQALVMNGKPGHVQFYSVHDDRQLFNLDIVGQNYISPENMDKPLTVTEVTHAAFDTSGCWLITTEYWNDGVMSPEIRLKFWRFLEEKQSYILNTTVEMAHIEKIDSLTVRPLSPISSPGTEHMVVTSSSEGKFKVWMLVDDTDIYRSNSKWTCESVGFYRDLPAGDTAFSEDGSLLAVVFGSCITLWDPEDNLLKETFLNNVNPEPVKSVIFGSHDCSQYLVSCTDKMLTVWNLISRAVYWSVDISISCLTKDPETDIMAAFTGSTDLFVFRPSDPSPVFSHIATSRSDVKSAVFIPHSKKNVYEKTTLSWQSHSELYFMNTDQELLVVTIESDKRESKSINDVVSFQQNLPQTALSLLMSGHANKSGSRVNQGTVAKEPEEKYLKEVISSAPHVQPSVTVLCRPFIQSLLRRTSTFCDDSDKDDDDDDFEAPSQTASLDSGVDSDMETEPSVTQSNSVTNNSKNERRQSGSKVVEEDTVRICKNLQSVKLTKTAELCDTDLKLHKLDWYTGSNPS